MCGWKSKQKYRLFKKRIIPWLLWLIILTPLINIQANPIVFFFLFSRPPLSFSDSMYILLMWSVFHGFPGWNRGWNTHCGANEGASSERKSSLLPRAFGLTTRSRLQCRQHIFQIKQLKAFWLFFNIATSKLKALLRLRPLSWSIFLGYTSHPSRFSTNMQNLCSFSLSDVFVSYYLLTKLSQKLSVQYLANKRGYNLVPRLFLLDLHLYDKESLETRLTTQLIIDVNKDTLTITLKNTLGSRAQFHFVYFSSRREFMALLITRWAV